MSSGQPFPSRVGREIEAEISDGDWVAVHIRNTTGSAAIVLTWPEALEFAKLLSQLAGVAHTTEAFGRAAEYARKGRPPGRIE